jgi:hypothetical protein
MTNISSQATLLGNDYAGKQLTSYVIDLQTGATTASGAIISGWFNCMLKTNNKGTTYPGTLVSFPLPVAQMFLTSYGFGGNQAAISGWLARFYQMGTIDFTATGDRFTADAAVTYPLTRTIYGVAGQAISLYPVIYITTATTGTAPQFQLNTAAAGAGYVDQDGNSTVGTKTFTFPSATTAIQSTYLLRLEEGDGGVQSISAVQCTVKGTAGVGTIYGVELLCPCSNLNSGSVSFYDAVYGALNMVDLNPAVPTAGTLTTFLGFLALTNTQGTSYHHIGAVLNV